MDPVESDLGGADICFSWPYRFYCTDDIQQSYNANHDCRAVDIIYDDENHVFHLLSSYEDVEFHRDHFMFFIDAYIQKEQSKADTDLISEDPPQIGQLWTTANSRTNFYDMARKDDNVEQYEDNGGLIQMEQLRQTIPFSSHVAKAKHINKKLFEVVASNYKCFLNWNEFGLQILSDDRTGLQGATGILTPAIHLLEGVSIDIYWVDKPTGLLLRFMKMARPVDHSVFRSGREFSRKHYDLHLVYWDIKSAQYISLRPKSLSEIEFQEPYRNPWNKIVKCGYGEEQNAPAFWVGDGVLDQALSSNFMATEQLSGIQSWRTKIDSVDESEASVEHSSAPSISAESEPNRPKLMADGKHILNKEDDLTTGDIKETDIVEKTRSLLDDLDFDRPRVRPTPRLKASASIAESVTSSDHRRRNGGDRPDFMNILVDSVVKLITAIKLQTHEAAFFTVNLGQLFIRSKGIPERYRPDGGRTSDAFLPMEWSQFFSKENDSAQSTGTHFSRRLTSVYDDAFSMATTTLKSAKNVAHPELVFTFKPWSDRTYYRLECQNTLTGTIAVIEIDNKQNARIKPRLRELGHVNIHFPEYIWDARISAALVRSLSELDLEAFGKLLATVWIGVPDQDPSQPEKLYARQENMKILSCHRHRERIHRTTEKLPDDQAVHLHITRVEDLHISNILSAPGGFCCFSTGQDVNEETRSEITDREQRLWFEAHLHSESINGILPVPTSTNTSMPYTTATMPNQDYTFTPPAQNEALQGFLQDKLSTLFNATHCLVSSWNCIGARDRAKAPVSMKAMSTRNGGAGKGSSASAGFFEE